jgi:hypothetical protein
MFVVLLCMEENVAGWKLVEGDATTKRLLDFKLSMIFSAFFFFFLDFILIFSIV